ncbi:MAG: Na(+)-translocating NADH-quinone reductase subunit A [Muribaculaceae bacterium]|nr:Na(+)-translocating NADH-quinone reductase subunit A [Muribaculaceae bacterium]
MTRKIKIKRGLDIPLAGAAGERIESINPQSVGITPLDFEGHTWKCCVKEGDAVGVGSPLFHDKATGKIKIVSPVAGEIKEVKRGERRRILNVSIAPKAEGAETISYDLGLTKETIRETLLASGLWAMMRQRPYDIVPDADSEPRDIFVTAFDTAPLAPALFSEADIPAIEKGLEVLGILAGKKPVVSTSETNPVEFKNAENLIVSGPHPAGNTGVQIAAVAPVNKGETVWTLDIATVKRIGKLYTDGKGDWSCKVAITGPEIKDPHRVETVVGASIESLLAGNLKEEKGLRIISGNVLTGKRCNLEDGYLRYPYRQITVIKEGDNADEFMGWASMSPKKYSVKRTFPAFLKGLRSPFPFDARIKGGKRAMILSGELDKVFPFDIYPEYLVRAIEAGDIDRMEKLGIFEVAPEDFALPEFVDTSKHEFQSMIREALDKLRAESL